MSMVFSTVKEGFDGFQVDDCGLLYDGKDHDVLAGGGLLSDILGRRVVAGTYVASND